jgi:hypothetical protein
LTSNHIFPYIFGFNLFYILFCNFFVLQKIEIVLESNFYKRKKMYCKVCFDAGKPEEVFTSHSVKNEFGMITCVTLLSHHCEICGCIGHTPKYCPAPKMFCAFCKDIGLEYKDHNMWDNGLIVCMELMCTQCFNCGELGHTPKYCSERPKFCPVCRDAERDHNHDLMQDGVVVCEYLLSLECPNCGELGHTRKYCTRPSRTERLHRAKEGDTLGKLLEDALQSDSAPKTKNKGKKKYVRVL